MKRRARVPAESVRRGEWHVRDTVLAEVEPVVAVLVMVRVFVALISAA